MVSGFINEFLKYHWPWKITKLHKCIHIVKLTCTRVVATVSGRIGNSACWYLSIICSRSPLCAHSKRNENDMTHKPRNCTMLGWSIDISLFNSKRTSPYIAASSSIVKSCWSIMDGLVKHFKAACRLESYKYTYIKRSEQL